MGRAAHAEARLRSPLVGTGQGDIGWQRIGHSPAGPAPPGEASWWAFSSPRCALRALPSLFKTLLSHPTPPLLPSANVKSAPPSLDNCYRTVAETLSLLTVKWFLAEFQHETPLPFPWPREVLPREASALSTCLGLMNQGSDPCSLRTSQPLL